MLRAWTRASPLLPTLRASSLRCFSNDWPAKAGEAHATAVDAMAAEQEMIDQARVKEKREEQVLIPRWLQRKEQSAVEWSGIRAVRGRRVGVTVYKNSSQVHAPGWNSVSSHVQPPFYDTIVGLALRFNPTTYRWPIHLSRTSIFHSIHRQFYFVGTH